MRSPHEVVVSGLGVVTAAGVGADAFWDRCYRGTAAYADVPLFGGRPERQRVGRVDDALLGALLPSRDARKLDRFSLMAVAAARQALAAAGVRPTDPRRADVGVCVGNCTAGWTFVEPLMYGLLSRGPQAITPYVATAWFPAAAQGEVSILEQLGGFSKTVSAGHASGAVAVHMGAHFAADGSARGMLAGGAEAPLTGLVYAAFEESGCVGHDGYRLHPDPDVSGALLGEGAALLYLETAGEATARAARPLVEVAACTSGAGLADVILAALDQAEACPRDVDYVVMNGRGAREHDEREMAALRKVFEHAPAVAFSAPRTLFGDTLGAAAALDLAAACLSVQRQAVLPTLAAACPAPLPIPGTHVIGQGRPRPVGTALVYGCGEGEQAVAAVLRRPPPG